MLLRLCYDSIRTWADVWWLFWHLCSIFWLKKKYNKGKRIKKTCGRFSLLDLLLDLKKLTSGMPPRLLEFLNFIYLLMFPVKEGKKKKRKNKNFSIVCLKHEKQTPNNGKPVRGGTRSRFFAKFCHRLSFFAKDVRTKLYSLSPIISTIQKS